LATQITGTTASLIYGDIIPAIDLFYGMMLPSGNDAALSLAIGFGTLLFNF